MTAAGSFREDLYYRLAEIVIPIPSLAERSGDAVLLARHFTNRFARELSVKVQGLAPDAVEAIAAYRWPGNVRELENRIKRAVIMADGKMLAAADLDASPGQRRTARDQPARGARSRRPQGDRPGAGAHRKQHLERRQAARDQPPDALRSDQAISAGSVNALAAQRFGHLRDFQPAHLGRVLFLALGVDRLGQRGEAIGVLRVEGRDRGARPRPPQSRLRCARSRPASGRGRAGP